MHVQSRFTTEVCIRSARHGRRQSSEPPSNARRRLPSLRSTRAVCVTAAKWWSRLAYHIIALQSPQMAVVCFGIGGMRTCSCFSGSAGAEAWHRGGAEDRPRHGAQTSAVGSGNNQPSTQLCGIAISLIVMLVMASDYRQHSG